MNRRLFVCAFALVVSFLTAVAAAAAGNPRWPSLDEQLAKHGIAKGTALERLVRENQDFSLLRADEADDPRGLPPWLKVYWRKGHPEGTYTAEDPTGGYPLVLKEMLEWMTTHQDLRPGMPERHMRPEWDEQPSPMSEDEAQEERERVGLAPLALAPLAGTAGTNVRASGAQSAARSESDIRVNYWNTQKIIAASNNIASSGFQGQYWSTDGGATWGQTVLPNPLSNQFNSDPTVDWTSDGTAWSTTMGISGSTNKILAFKSTDSGATWSYDNTVSGSQTAVDKQMMWVDHSASSTYKNNIYVIWHNNNPVYMNRRTSSGWGTPIQVSSSETTSTGIGADVKSNANGDVFGFWPDTGSRGLYVVKSTNGGTSYGTPVKIATTYDSYDIGVPSFASRRILIYVSGGTYRNGTTDNVYAAWTDLSGDSGCTSASSEPGTNASSTCKTRVWFARSTNGGASWLAPVRLNHPSSLNDQFNQFLAVDETNGTVAVIYYDTVADTTRKKTNVYYQSSTDGGATWSAAVKVTTAQTDETSSGADSGNQYGDYNSLSGYANVFFPSWTDRRSNSYEEIWTAKITEGGGATTYSISGSAGTTAATVTAGSGSATSDASGNYAISGLAAGTYTVTPSKSGCTFSPASASVTVGPSATGVNFTASCTVTTYSISGNAGTSGATVTAGSASATSDASSNYTLSGFAAGTYTVTPSKSGCTFSPASMSVTVGPNATGKNFTATCGTADIALTSGVTVSGQSVAQGAWKYYYITVPSGATNLTFATSGATADVDIYTQFNAKPTLTTYTCRPYTSSGNETCSATNPSAGTWWLGVYGYAAGSYSVTATITTSTPTYAISGSAGTSGATVTAGTKSATSDASNNYSIAGLANGTYTVTPSKSGCTFSPASSSVTVNGANVSGVNFTATCSGAATLFSDGFEAAGWSTAQVSGTGGAWTLSTSGTHPTVTPHGGSYLAKFNSYTSSSGSQTRLYKAAGFAVASTYTTVTLKFWMYHDTGYSTYADKVQPQVSTNGGSTWTSVGTAIARYDGSTGWKQHSVDITTYKGQTVSLGFLGMSAYGNDEHLDDVTVTAQ